MADTRKLIEGIDDPESFDVQGHLTSPVARIAATNGFTRSDRNDHEERWVKKLSHDKEVWLRTRPVDPDLDARPFDPKDPHTTGGRPWELVDVSYPLICSHCHQERKGKTGPCPHCKQKAPVNKERYVKQLAQANEMAMSYLLGAMLQRLATWPAGMPKPGEPGGDLAEARKPKVPLPDLDDPAEVVNTFVASKVPYLPEYAKLARLIQEHPEIYIRGQVRRTDHHYVHQYTTTFSLEMYDLPPEVDTEETGELANAVEKLIQEECVKINGKIYKALEREYEWLTSAESIDETIEANDWTFDEDGNIHDGELTFAQLSDEAKETARQEYRENGLDYNWWEHIYEEWTTELEEMGFDGIEISYNGFWSQGDGASFTAESFDFMKWANWHMSNKPLERGHPYTDDLAEALDPDDPETFMLGLGQMPKHELVNTSSPPPGTSCSYACVCGQWSFGGVAATEAEKCDLAAMARAEFQQHAATSLLPRDHDALQARNFITARRLKEGDDPEIARIRKRVNKIKAEREAAELAKNPEILALDDPDTILKQEVERRSEPIKKLEVRGRRWFRRGAGGVYCKAYIYINDKLVHVTPEQYGYGDHYLTLAKDWLMRNGYLVGLLDDERDPLWTLRDRHKIDLQYGVVDVARERDL